MVSKGGSINISPTPPKPSVLYLLANSGLMADPYVTLLSFAPGEIRIERRLCFLFISQGGNQLVKAADRLQITSRGFQFLLEDVHTQQWDLMLNYLRLAPVRFPQYLA